MAIRRFFSGNHENYQLELFAVIAGYVQENKDKWLHRSGVARARALKEMIASQLVANQGLTDLQLMWRLYSYVEMARCVGPLDTSTDLRFAILDHLCQFLNISSVDISKTEMQKRMVVVQARRSAMQTGMVGPMVFDEQRIKEEARSVLVLRKLTRAVNAKLGTSEEYKMILLDAIDAYQAEARTKWFKGEGIERADQLKDFVNTQLIGREKLDDRQLCARMLELLRMPVGCDQGKLGTSKDLRHALLKSMCQYLQVDEQKILDEIAPRAMPHIVQSGLGPVGYYPNYAMESILVRVKYLEQALNRIPNVISVELADPDLRSIAFGH